MAKKRILWGFGIGLIGLMMFAVVTVGAVVPNGQYGPYTGVIKNCTRHSISFPSANSAGTLVVPPGGWTEYVTWRPEFQLMGYWEGRPVYCQKVMVQPQKYAFMCKPYDFLVKIVKEQKEPVCPKQPQQQPQLRSNEVEGLG